MNKKRSVQLELADLDLAIIMRKMNDYATKRLERVDVKQLEGRAPENFTSDVLTKVLEGTFNWRTSKLIDFKKFLFGCLSGEIHNFLDKINRRKISIVEILEDEFDFENESGVALAVPHPFKGSEAMLDQSNDESFHPKGYNNMDDEDAYYSQ